MNLSQFVPVSGVYKITCTSNERVYIGQSKNIYQRWATHSYDLFRGKHSNLALLEDCVLYGMKAFEAEILEECHPSDLLHKEQEWITWMYENGRDLYNLQNDARVRSALGLPAQATLAREQAKLRREKELHMP